ncbi:MAG: cation:proton antiporter [Desulfobacteraceae bacterium]|nr:cation:proton antiporter [Desulfobacteraceae bacterium]
MESLTPHDIVILFFSLGILLALARVLGELAQHLHQPAILGELLAGILLGPTVLGNIAPQFNSFLFPSQGPCAIALDTITTLAVALFLLVAGIEVDLSTVWRQGQTGIKVGLAGIVLPFICGFGVAWLAPQSFGHPPEADKLIFSLFLATAMSITALPVIAKTLMDMDLYRSDLGMVVVSAAIFNDLTGWIVFAVLLSLMGKSPLGNHNSIALIIVLTLALAGIILTLGRWLIHKALPFVQAYTRWPGGELSFALILAFLGAALAEWIGIHAIFGAFLVGVAIGDSAHLRERTRVIIDQFVSFIFAPVFFASIGLKVNFFTHFNLWLVLLVLVIACSSKLAGSILGARWGAVPVRDAWAVGFAMNSRGAMEIILGLLALQAGIITHSLFVALVIMALITSLISGPMMRLVLRPAKRWRLHDMLTSKLFSRQLQAISRREVIREMAELVSAAAGLEPQIVEATVWEREEALSTGIGNGVALPHARIDGLRQSVIGVGISESGIDFDAPDDKLAHVIFLILTPKDDPGQQLDIAAELARKFRDQRMLDHVKRTRSFTDFLALMRASMH